MPSPSHSSRKDRYSKVKYNLRIFHC
jgi:hypothetical protein